MLVLNIFMFVINGWDQSLKTHECKWIKEDEGSRSIWTQNISTILGKLFEDIWNEGWRLDQEMEG